MIYANYSIYFSFLFLNTIGGKISPSKNQRGIHVKKVPNDAMANIPAKTTKLYKDNKLFTKRLL